LGEEEARAKVRMSVSVSVKETRRGGRKWRVWKMVKTAGGSRFIYAEAASPGGDARQTARRAAVSGGGGP
jgi:hypothetical protein